MKNLEIRILLIGLIISENSRHYYIHFSGTSVNTLLSECALYYSGIYPIGTFNELISAVPKICCELAQRNIFNEYKCNGLFIQLLGHISARITNIDTSASNSSERLTPAIQAMMTEFHIDHPLSYYAKLCNMSTSYFKHAFVAFTDITPFNYITSLRLDNAIMMMADPNKTIKEIAYTVGYADPLYFGRLFKKKFGMTPTEYKKANSVTPPEKINHFDFKKQIFCID